MKTSSFCKARIAIIHGDGIGPEITNAAIGVLNAVARKFSHEFTFIPVLLGGAAIDACGEPCPQKTIDECLKSDAVLFGAIGGPKWDNLPGNMRPEKGLLTIRSALKLYSNIRPALLYPQLKEASPLKNHLIENGIDFVVVRELTGGIYFGERGRKTTELGEAAYDTELYSVQEIERIAVCAFEYALTRRKKVTSVDKANVLESSRLWRTTVENIAKRYPSITLEHILVDNCAMQIVKNPAQFDVILCPNMFGDILSDEAAMVTGSIGMLPSCSLGATRLGLYEPIHGSAPDIAGKDIANPIATILSAAMLLETSLNLKTEANKIRTAVESVLSEGWRTADIYSKGTKKVTCSEMGKLVEDKI